MNKATFVRDIEGWTGDAKLYKLSPPAKYDGGTTEFVIVSATVALFSGPETYIFPSDEHGKVLDWGELRGSYRGGMNHNAALENAGYSTE